MNGAMTKDFDPFLVTLSVLVAVWASNEALLLVGRSTVTGGRNRPAWLLAGSLVLGTGIWCTHFVGMLALKLPTEVNYGVGLVATSLLVAIGASIAAFVVVSRRGENPLTRAAGALCLGVAISGMHFTGMAAMRVAADVQFEARLSALSVAIAIAASFVGLTFSFHSDGGRTHQQGDWAALLPGLLIASGIVGMHYTAMAAARFSQPLLSTGSSTHSAIPAAPVLAVVVTLGTGAMIGMSRLAVVISRREDEARNFHERYSAQMRSHAMRLQSTREEERTRIAREMHDELGQALTALRLDLGSLSAMVQDGPEGARKIEEMSVILDHTLAAVQRIASELRPPLLDHLGLDAAIRALADDFESRTGVQSHTEVTTDAPRLDDLLATSVYRVAQEALTNVARHANATRVDIRLRLTPCELDLRVQDDGRGITAQELADPRALGLLGMRERARSWDGELSVSGRDGGGTTVRLVIALGENATWRDVE